MTGRLLQSWPDVVRKAAHDALGVERGDHWLETPNRSLGCLPPAELIDDPIGAQMVLTELRDLCEEARMKRRG